MVQCAWPSVRQVRLRRNWLSCCLAVGAGSLLSGCAVGPDFTNSTSAGSERLHAEASAGSNRRRRRCRRRGATLCHWAGSSGGLVAPVRFAAAQKPRRKSRAQQSRPRRGTGGIARCASQRGRRAGRILSKHRWRHWGKPAKNWCSIARGGGFRDRDLQPVYRPSAGVLHAGRIRRHAANVWNRCKPRRTTSASNSRRPISP